VELAAVRSWRGGDGADEAEGSQQIVRTNSTQSHCMYKGATTHQHIIVRLVTSRCKLLSARRAWWLDGGRGLEFGQREWYFNETGHTKLLTPQMTTITRGIEGTTVFCT